MVARVITKDGGHCSRVYKSMLDIKSLFYSQVVNSKREPLSEKRFMCIIKQLHEKAYSTVRTLLGINCKECLTVLYTFDCPWYNCNVLYRLYSLPSRPLLALPSYSTITSSTHIKRAPSRQPKKVSYCYFSTPENKRKEEKGEERELSIKREGPLLWKGPLQKMKIYIEAAASATKPTHHHHRHHHHIAVAAMAILPYKVQ